MKFKCNFKLKIFLFFLSTLVLEANFKPVIGILTHPIPDEPEKITESFINLNYVKWFEAAGAEVIPIHSWLSDKELNEILDKVNGVLFQGGSASLKIGGPYTTIATKIFKRVLEEKDKNGKILPLWGTCLGFELLHVIVSGSLSILSDYNSYNIKSPLQIDSNANKKFKVFSLFDDDDILNLRTMPSTAEFHHYGVFPDDYNNFKDLNEFFEQTSFAFDLNNRIYIASIEAKNYPIFALQFHPEKTNFNQIPQINAPQGNEATRISENFVNFFTNLARSNSNKMSEEEKLRYELINSFEKNYEITSSSFIYRYKKSDYDNKKEILKFLEEKQ